MLVRRYGKPQRPAWCGPSRGLSLRRGAGTCDPARMIEQTFGGARAVVEIEGAVEDQPAVLLNRRARAGHEDGLNRHRLSGRMIARDDPERVVCAFERRRAHDPVALAVDG